MRRFALACAAFLTVTVSVAGCFDPDEPPCAFSCGPGGACPTDYACLSDGYCHLHGKPTLCGYSDLGTDFGFTQDLSSPPDDLGHHDLSVPDQSIPDQSIPDLETPPDQLQSTDLLSSDLLSSDLAADLR